MIWPKARNTRRIWGLLAALGLITTCLFSAQVFKYKKIKPEKGYLIREVGFHEIEGAVGKTDIIFPLPKFLTSGVSCEYNEVPQDPTMV